MIYLDHNATTPLCDAAAEAMQKVRRMSLGNPSSQHEAGRKARRLIEKARTGILELLGANTSGMNADECIFTSGGTEANNLAILGLATDPNRPVLISAIEHPSVKAAAAALLDHDIDVQLIRAKNNGEIDIDHFRAELNSDVQLVSIMLANHETGVIQPIHVVAEYCRQLNVPLHIDAVQAIGKSQVDFTEIGCQAMTIAAHKFHGPCGVGALIVQSGVTPQPLLHGGFQQAGIRPGTEDPALATGMHAALQEYLNDYLGRHSHMQRLRDLLEATIIGELSDTVVNGKDAQRLPNVANLAFPQVDRQALQMALDMAGIACSTGSACASGSSEPSPVLHAMGLADELISGSLRFSLGPGVTKAEIKTASERIIKCVNNLRSQKREA